MIENIEDFPDNVVALMAKGQVTKKDYEQVVIPKVEASLQRHAKIRLYYELGPQFSGFDPGAAWEDLKVGVEHLTRWERIAVVTDVDWMRHTFNAFRFLMPGKLRVFGTAQTSEARSWIADGSEA
jgi:SpoIIAA-like